jgi:phosphoglycolate phosphatase
MPLPTDFSIPRAVLFDLDGTLIDTLVDIAEALNRALKAHGYQALPLNTVRTMIGRGAAVLIQHALSFQDIVASQDQRHALYTSFLDAYARLLASGESRALAYAGAEQTLESLKTHQVPLAVVTNKNQDLALACLRHTGLLGYFATVTGGDTCAQRKPHPAPLLHTLAILKTTAASAVMVGDSVNDVQAARAAGMPVVCVPYGYNEGQDPAKLRCDALIASLTDLPRLLGLSSAGEVPTEQWQQLV